MKRNVMVFLLGLVLILAGGMSATEASYMIGAYIILFGIILCLISILVQKPEKKSDKSKEIEKEE